MRCRLFPTLTFGADARNQVRALCFCWLAVHGHVLGSPIVAGQKPPEQAERSAFATPSSDCPAGDCSGIPAENGTAPGHARPVRQLTENSYIGGPPFFQTDPYVISVVYDSHDPNCNRNYMSPQISDPALPGFPADGTNALRNKELACGIAPARFVFTTSDLPDYMDESVTAKMQVRIQLARSFFIEKDSCEDVLAATSSDYKGFPRIEACRFMSSEARFVLATRLEPGATYSITMKLINPPGRVSAADNSFHLTTEYYQSHLIEGTREPIDIIASIDTAKDQALHGSLYNQRGYITGFTWQPDIDYSPKPGVVSKFKFGLRTFGRMDENYEIDIVAHPTNVWRFGVPGNECDEFSQNGIVGVLCEYRSFAGALGTESNGFRIKVGATPMIDQASGTTFDLRLLNPLAPVNMYWTATSFRTDSDFLHTEAFTVWLDKPISVLGKPLGEIGAFELASIGAEQWVTLEFKPGNTIIPTSAGTTAGLIVIMPPEDFVVIASSAPQEPGPDYNALPCLSWPAEDREADPARWVCTVEDTAPMKDTLYRVRLKVRNPIRAGAAQSWRVEIWQDGQTKPVAISRSLLGIPISGGMLAALAPANQALGRDNLLRFDFTPSQDVGLVPETRLEVVAPEGFLIVKRCVGFRRIELPQCTCLGSDANGFSLTFAETDAIKAGTTYVFEVSVLNPMVNVPNDENFWTFETVRPDGVPRDSTRYGGFFLFPSEISQYEVVPVARRTGPQFVVARFTSSVRIPFDDWISVRAPNGVVWDASDLGFDSSAAATNATALGTRTPEVDLDNPSILTVQLTATAEAEFQYGIRARCIVPDATPVPNRWWIEQKRQTGNPAPNQWRYIAAQGAEGFKTQVLVNAQVTPFNIVEEAWQNPTLIVFEPTEPVQARMEQTASGPQMLPAELYVEAPVGFTYICPLTPTVYLPDYTVDVPDDVECVVRHNVQTERNKLHLYFPSGIEAGTRYAFTIDVVNGALSSLDLSNNFFRLVTRVGGEEVEDVILPGYNLAQRMDNTRFVGGITNGENRFPEWTTNKLTFIIGTTFRADQDTILQVRGPVGFRFPLACIPGADVFDAGQVIGGGMMALPTIETCQSMETISAAMANIVRLSMTGSWMLGNAAVTVTTINPMFTPDRNFWGFTIYDRSLVPLMAEAWVYGFMIQEVLNPVLIPYNSGNGNAREAAINRIEVSFTLTTAIAGMASAQSSIVVTAPEGFIFPTVCRFFSPDTNKVGKTPLPSDTTCQGDGAQQLTLVLPVMRSLENGTNYEFRFRVINPLRTFTVTNVESLYWQIETRRSDGTRVDRNRVIPSFPVYQRVSYFEVDTLSQVGLASTTFRFHFRTDAPLPPQQTVTIKPPMGTVFGGLAGGECIDEDPVLLSREFTAAGLRPLISGVSRLPEWMSCAVIGPEELQLKNEESILGGRPLINGPVFEFFIKNATNSESTPPAGLNLFEIVAQTSTPLGQERWAADGWVIYPELRMTSVEVSNPGYGLYTNFTIRLQPVTEVPAQGRIRIEGPNDYFFGPLDQVTALALYDPLVPMPPPQGTMENRPSVDQLTVCHILRTPNWICPLEFYPCTMRDHYLELESIGVALSVVETGDKNLRIRQCDTMAAACDEEGRLSDLVTCESRGSWMEVIFAPMVSLPANRLFTFLVQGYNARNPPASAALNMWNFLTIDSDSERTVLDRKRGVPGPDLIGIVHVDTIFPSDTKVGSIENYVTITIRLSTPCLPPAVLRIEHPLAYLRNANAAFQGSGIQTGSTFPRMTEKRQQLNVIDIEAMEETLPADVPLEIRLGLSNPQISPPLTDNVWRFTAFSKQSGVAEMLNVNLNVTGFKVFGEFSLAFVAATVLSPVSPTILAVWFKLKSELRPQDGIQNKLKIWLPKQFVPRPPVGNQCEDFMLQHNPNREGVAGFAAVSTETATVTFLPIPSGTECSNHFDEQSGQYYTLLLIGGLGGIGGLLDYGLDYAFEFGITNPAIAAMPPPAENVWRLESLKDDVILHLASSLPGYELEQIKEATVTASDTTKRKPFTLMTIYMMSDKYLQGGSKIFITAPEGFVFTCAYFRTDSGLSNTTTCLIPNIRTPHRVEFTIDSQDPKPPNSPFTLFVYVTNPEFTPNWNFWTFQIKNPLGRPTDIREFIPGFDVTDEVAITIDGTFPYLGEVNPLRVAFVQNTILNQADVGNELVLSGPSGYVFPRNCTQGFRLRLTNNRDAQVSAASTSEYAETFTFPPKGIQCTGFDNSTVVIRMPDGSGLLKGNYTIEVDVTNPPFQPNGTNTWRFLTRVRNPSGQKIVDDNRIIEGFDLRILEPVRTVESAALGCLPRYDLILAMFSLLLFLSERRKLF